MFRIRRRFHGTIGPAVLKSTFFVPPGCQNAIPGDIFIGAEVLAPCLPCFSLPAAPVHPCLFPSLLASARPPDSGPADRRESSGAVFHSPREAILGDLGSPHLCFFLYFCRVTCLICITLSVSLSIYIYIYRHMYIYIYIYIYIILF